MIIADEFKYQKKQTNSSSTIGKMKIIINQQGFKKHLECCVKKEFYPAELEHWIATIQKELKTENFYETVKYSEN